MSVKEAASAILDARRIRIGTHVNPDGDTLGSGLALALALRRLRKKVEILCQDPVPVNLTFLPGSELVRPDTTIRTPDLGVLVDLEGLSRVGKLQPLFEGLERVVTIDHHIPEKMVGDVRVIEPDAASTSELVYRVLRQMGVEIDGRIATCLLTGLVTDTGGFRFAATRPKHLELAAKLMRDGADISRIYEEAYENRSFGAQRLLGRALAALKHSKDGRVVWTSIRCTDFKETGSADEDTDGIVNHVRMVTGADVGLLFRETRRGRVRVSLRSRADVNVAEIAKRMGGGGHKNAAGCSFESPLEPAIKKVLAEVKKWMGS